SKVVRVRFQQIQTLVDDRRDQEEMFSANKNIVPDGNSGVRADIIVWMDSSHIESRAFKWKGCQLRRGKGSLCDNLGVMMVETTVVDLVVTETRLAIEAARRFEASSSFMFCEARWLLNLSMISANLTRDSSRVGGLDVNIEHMVKVSEKAHILEHKRRVQESLLILTTNTPYHSRSIRRIQDFDELKDHCLTLENTPYPHQRYAVYNTLVNEEEPTGFISIRRLFKRKQKRSSPIIFIIDNSRKDNPHTNGNIIDNKELMIVFYSPDDLNIEHMVKVSEKAHILEHKRRVQESLLILTTNTPYHSRSIRRIQDFDELKDHCLTLENTPYPHQRYAVYNTLVNEEEPTGFISIRRIHQEDTS
nr:hypothetical protein [Tanacetum cinerariifolium]